MKKILLILLSILPYLTNGQATIDNVPIGEILASMPSGITLRDGTILRAEVISLGTAASSYPDHGLYNQYLFGGTFNGVNDGAAVPTGPDGLTLSGYSGSANPLDFTRINADPRGDIDRGDLSNFRNAIGFHFWADRPILAKELLLIDCDGANSSNNREWFTIFGYNGTTAIDPSVSLSGGTELVQGLETVHSDWHTLVDAEITGAVPVFTQKRIAKNTTAITPSFNDPDNVNYQALFDFGSSKVDHLFILWGVRDNLTATPAGAQNSGVSPLVFEFGFDYGDAPDSYGTSKASNGPVHVYPELGPRLRLGATITEEGNGIPSLAANTDTDDGIASIDSIFRRPLFATDTISSYTLTVSYNNPTGNTANYVAWIDWNNNGVFNTGEGLTATSAAGSTSGTVSFTWTNRVMTNHTSTDHTYARIRVTTESISTAQATNAPFQDGEVEDYYIPFSDLGVGPLPLKLLSYNAYKVKDKVRVEWNVNDQYEVAFFEIMRSSNGVSFDKINTIMTQQNNNGKYFIEDENPISGINYYRLKINNLDNTFFFVPQTVSVNMGEMNTEISVYPNPVMNKIFVESANEIKNAMIIVYDVFGRKILKIERSILNTELDLSSLVNGQYHLAVFSDGKKIMGKDIQISK